MEYEKLISVLNLHSGFREINFLVSNMIVYFY